MSAANVLIDPSQFPEAVWAQLLESLRARKINHKFHYDSYKQAHKWLALHEAYSPARRDIDCERIYNDAFKAVACDIKGGHVIGLGCGGGQKEARLLKLLRDASYSPCDVSLALVLTARAAASASVPDARCWPVVCDLAEANDVSALFPSQGQRIVTFFGMIPNFEPQMILPKLASVLARDDVLLFSANLAPGENYAAGVNKVLSQYDNELTAGWLMTLLFDLGVEPADGSMSFEVEEAQNGLRRIVAQYHFDKSRDLQVGHEKITIQRGEKIRLFFSYRYQPGQVVALLKEHGIEVVDRWITQSQEEGVFLCRRI
jgi:L-histidine N-alpha-methyltransferase